MENSLPSPIVDPESSDEDIQLVEPPTFDEEIEKIRGSFKHFIEDFEKDPEAFDNKFRKFFNFKTFDKFVHDLKRFKNNNFADRKNDQSYPYVLTTYFKKLASIEKGSKNVSEDFKKINIVNTINKL